MAKSSRKQGPDDKRAQHKHEKTEAKRKTRKQIAFGRKEARQRRIILLSVGALALMILIILVVAVVQETLIKPGKPVAIVNDTQIRVDDYQDALTYRRYNLHGNELNLLNTLNSVDTTDPNNDFFVSFYQQQLSQIQQALVTVAQDTLDEMIEDVLIREETEKLGITVTDADVQETLFPTAQTPTTGAEEVPTPVPQEELDQRYENLLNELSISDKRFRAIVQRGLLREKLQETLAEQVPTTGLVIHVHLIETATEEDALAAKARIEGGEDFGLVAQEVYSQTYSVESDGDLDWITTGQLSEQYNEEFESQVFSIPVDQVSYLATGEQFFVLWVSERDENGPLPEQVVSQRQNSALADWLTEIIDSPDVTIERLLQISQIPADPFQIPAGLPASPGY